MQNKMQVFIERFVLPTAFITLAPVIGVIIIFLVPFIIALPFAIPSILKTQYEFSQTIPATDEEQIIAIAERDLFESWSFRNHTEYPVPYKCDVAKDQKWSLAKIRAGLNFDHIVICKIPVNCGGYRFEKHYVYYIVGVRVPGDWGRTGGEYEMDGSIADHSKMVNCNHIYD